MEKVIVTRHPALVEFLRELGVEGAVVSHASEETVQGKHVFGVLPMRLASLCGRFTEVSLTIPAELRGKELSLEEVKACNPAMQDWVVRPEGSVASLTDLLSPEEVTPENLAALGEQGWMAVKLDSL